MVLFVITFAARSRSLKGYGKVAWREWTVRRSFENHELSHLPAVGDRRHFGAEMMCTGTSDNIGGRRKDGSWDAALPVTVYFFEPANARREVGGIPCQEGDETTVQALRQRLEQMGFDVTIADASSNQEPIDIQPPTNA
jgi:hypothetical protein